MGSSLIGIDGGAILLDRVPEAIGLWTFTAYEGDVERNEHGRVLNPVVAQWSQRNLITTVGKGLILDRLFGLSAAVAVSGTAVGTSATAAAVGDTTITGAVYQAFDATPTRSSLTVTATTTYGTATANINIQEAGLLTASGGVLLNRLAPVLSFTKTTAISLAVQTTITQS
ncbi:MAG: hypothetical protein ACXVGE_13020 [Blastococcus sp.]